MPELAGNQTRFREPFCLGRRERRGVEAHCVLCPGLALHEEQSQTEIEGHKSNESDLGNGSFILMSVA